MAKHARRANRSAHPGWCNFRYDGSDDHHDPHLSTRERVDADFPSDLVIEAYLLKPEKVKTRYPKEPLAALEFHDPGVEEPVHVQMTSYQLRRLYEAISRLLCLAQYS